MTKTVVSYWKKIVRKAINKALAKKGLHKQSLDEPVHTSTTNDARKNFPALAKKGVIRKSSDHEKNAVMREP